MSQSDKLNLLKLEEEILERENFLAAQHRAEDRLATLNRNNITCIKCKYYREGICSKLERRVAPSNICISFAIRG